MHLDVECHLRAGCCGSRYLPQDFMSTLPVRKTFIDFHVPIPQPRSASAPPRCSGHSAPESRKRRRSRRHPSKCPEDMAIQEYRSKTLLEIWVDLMERLCAKRVRDAKKQSTFVPRLRCSLSRQIFRDFAFYTFVSKGHTCILGDLCRTGFIHENKDQNCFEFWSSDVHFFENQFLRNLVSEADKLREAKDEGYFSVLVNTDFVVCILYTAQLLVKDVISQTRSVLNFDGGKVVAKHRNRMLHPGRVSEQGVGPGSHFTLDFL